MRNVFGGDVLNSQGPKSEYETCLWQKLPQPQAQIADEDSTMTRLPRVTVDWRCCFIRAMSPLHFNYQRSDICQVRTFDGADLCTDDTVITKCLAAIETVCSEEPFSHACTSQSHLLGGAARWGGQLQMSLCCAPCMRISWGRATA